MISKEINCAEHEYMNIALYEYCLLPIIDLPALINTALNHIKIRKQNIDQHVATCVVEDG